MPLQTLFAHMPYGVVHGRLVRDQEVPVDVVTLSCNPAFVSLTGASPAIGGSIGGLIPGGCFLRVASSASAEQVEWHNPANDRWFDVAIYSPVKGEFVAVLQDITLRKEVEDARRVSEERYRSLFEDAPVGIVYTDPASGKIQRANRSACAFFGYTQVEICALGRDDLRHPEEPGISPAQVADLRASGRYRAELRYLTKDRRVVWGRVNATIQGVSSSPEPTIVAFIEDITAEREAQQRSRDLDALLTTVFRISTAAILVARGPNGRILEANDAFGRLTGWDRAEFIGRTTGELGIYRNPQERTQLYEDLAAHGEATPRVLQLRTRTGEERAVLFTAGSATIRGEPCAIGVLHDVTALLAADRALDESEGRFRAMFERAAVAIGLTDPVTRRFILVNDAECALVGYTREELLERPFTDILHPDELATAEEVSRQLIEGQVRAATRESRIIHKDGHVIAVRATVSAAPAADGSVGALISVLEDVTQAKRAESALRASEERYRSLVDNLDDVIVSTDAQGRITFVSASIAKYGYRPADLVGTSAVELIFAEDRPAVAAETREWRAAIIGRPVERRLVDAAGKPHFVRVVSRRRDAEGEPAGHTTVIADLTRLRETEQELRAAQKMEAVGRLAGGIAHDFNNILSVVLAYTESALEELGDEHPIRPDLTEVRDAGARAAALTQQLLAFSRKQVMAVERIDLGALVEGLGRMLRRVIGEDILLTIRGGAGVFPVRGDRGQVEQVVVNLVVNARDAMPKGGELVIATANAVLDSARAASLDVEAGDYAVLEVSDTGIGMDSATRDRIFEPFFTTKSVGKGTGLGLSTVYGIVKQSRGAIELDTEAGKGTRFRILLPRDTTLRVVPPSLPPPPK